MRSIAESAEFDITITITNMDIKVMVCYEPIFAISLLQSFLQSADNQYVECKWSIEYNDKFISTGTVMDD